MHIHNLKVISHFSNYFKFLQKLNNQTPTLSSSHPIKDLVWPGYLHQTFHFYLHAQVSLALILHFKKPTIGELGKDLNICVS